jgi:superfamily II DNA or RNA helicase
MAAGTRPYFTTGIADLEWLAAKHSSNPVRLRQLADELRLRATPRATALLSEIEQKLRALGARRAAEDRPEGDRESPKAELSSSGRRSAGASRRSEEWSEGDDAGGWDPAEDVASGPGSRRPIVMPDWKAWLAENADKPASDRRDYDLHLAAHEWSLASALDINSIEDFESLPSPTIEPFKHQVDDAILFFRRLAPRGLIADDVGLGKTITSGIIARELLDRGRIETILVVCPRSLVEQWCEELDSKFGIAAQTGPFVDLERYPFWITTYDTAAKRTADIRARKFDLLILDEAHALRNLYGAQNAPKRAVAFEELMKQDAARFVLMLTATPIQNRLWDMFSLLEVLRAPQPNPLGMPDEFRRTFLADATARRFRLGMDEAFRRKVSDTTIRTRRADSGLLFPEREVKDQRLVPLPEEKDFIDRSLEAILPLPRLEQITHSKTLMSSPFAAAAAFERLARDPRFPPADRERFRQLSVTGRSLRASAKTRAVVELAKASLEGGRARRVIVFTQRLETLRHLAQALEAAGLGSQIGVVQGGEHLANRRAIRDFMADPSVRPILLSTDTGAVGLNLQAGNIIVNYDLPWNPMLVEQRIGRVQRLGQKANKVIVYNLVLSGTIEDHVVLRLMEKLNLFNQAIGEMEELLEICGFDEEHRPLEQIVMDLIRKAAEQKDIQEDLDRMERSRREAEHKLREMREASDQALKSMRPKDTGVRLEGLERPDPRMPLRDLIVGALSRSGVVHRTDDDGRIFAKMRDGETQLCIDRHDFVPGNERMRLVTPGTRAFERITKQARDEISHHALDATDLPLDRVRESIVETIAPWGMLVEELSECGAVPVFASRIVARVSARVANDQYESIVEQAESNAADGIASLLGSTGEVIGPEDKPLPKVTVTDIKKLAPDLAGMDLALKNAALANPSVERFCTFYDHRYQEDLERLATHVRGRYSAIGSDQEVTARAAKEYPDVRVAMASLRSRFSPEVRVDPIGFTGILYDRVTVEAKVRNRDQAVAHPIRIEAVPLTGALRSPVPLTRELFDGEQGWGCPGGHVAPAADFRSCAGAECSVGLCSACRTDGRINNLLEPCAICSTEVCEDHRESCAGCGKMLCLAHAQRLDDGSGWGCSDCAVELEGDLRALARNVAESAVSRRRGIAARMARSELSDEPAFDSELVNCEVTSRRVLPSELRTCAITGVQAAADLVETSAVSGKVARRDRMVQSVVSNRYCLPGEEIVCDETGALILPDEVGICSRTGKHVQRSLLEENAETGELVLRRLLERSDESGRFALPEHMAKSEKSDRRALPSELIVCEVCGAHVLASEARRCTETGRLVCAEHLARCEKTGAEVLPEALATCAVSGRRVRKSSLQRCAETGKLADPDLMETCAESGARVLPEELETCSVTGKRVRRSMLARCAETDRPALPSALAVSSVSGKAVLPDLLMTCPETALKLLPSEAARCEETGALVHSSALGECAETHRRVRRSLLGIDDVTGDEVQARLLSTCEVTGKRTLARNLAVSSVSGKRAIKDLFSKCAETGRVAMPDELRRCAATGAYVHPDLLIHCPESGTDVLRRVAQRCEISGDLVAPGSLATCEKTGKTVRRSLVESDEVDGRRVLRSLLSQCEVTGRKTMPEHLVRSAVSGKLVLSDISVQCAETGAPALPEELRECSATGKRVIPRVLHKCAESGALVVRDALATCAATGNRVLPQYLFPCSRSGKRVVRSALARSELSGDEGLETLLTRCDASNRRVFPDELALSELSGKRVCRDRIRKCSRCGRAGDLTEVTECKMCAELVCTDDIEGSGCRVCTSLIRDGGGRALTRDELAQLQKVRPWVRRARILDGQIVSHLVARGGRLFGRRDPMLLLTRRAGYPGSRFGEVIREVGIDVRKLQSASPPKTNPSEMSQRAPQ